MQLLVIDQDHGFTCGTHLGDTNEPASMLRTPVFASLLINSTLVSRDIEFFSFCSPSLGPTSIIRISPAPRYVVVEKVFFRVTCFKILEQRRHDRSTAIFERKKIRCRRSWELSVQLRNDIQVGAVLMPMLPALPDSAILCCRSRLQ